MASCERLLKIYHRHIFHPFQNLLVSCERSLKVPKVYPWMLSRYKQTNKQTCLQQLVNMIVKFLFKESQGEVEFLRSFEQMSSLTWLFSSWSDTKDSGVIGQINDVTL